MGKKSKKAKKGKADKLPKTIAGVKVPKELRDAGGVLFKLAREPSTREVALAALTAALAARKDTRKAARSTATDASETAGKAMGWVGPALTAAAVEAGRLLIDAYEHGGNQREKSSGNGDGDEKASASTHPITGGKGPKPEVTH